MREKAQSLARVFWKKGSSWVSWPVKHGRVALGTGAWSSDTAGVLGYPDTLVLTLDQFQILDIQVAWKKVVHNHLISLNRLNWPMWPAKFAPGTLRGPKHATKSVTPCAALKDWSLLQPNHECGDIYRIRKYQTASTPVQGCACSWFLCRQGCDFQGFSFGPQKSIHRAWIDRHHLCSRYQIATTI